MANIYIDIGGTNIEMIFDENNNIVYESFPVNNFDKDNLLKKIAAKIDSKHYSQVSISISSPTAINTKTGECVGLSGIKGYENFNLYNELSPLIKTKIIKLKATNDGNAALLGILAHEFKEKPQSAIMLALGTGIGGSIYIGGKIFNGFNNMAGEFGYPIWKDNRNISQSLSPVNVFKKIDQSLSGDKIMEKYNNNKNIQDKIDEWIHDLSKLISYISFFFNPEVIVFNGGVFKNNDFKILLKEKFDAYLKNNGLNNLSKTKLFLLKNTKNYALIGAKELLNDM